MLAILDTEGNTHIFAEAEDSFDQNISKFSN